MAATLKLTQIQEEKISYRRKSLEVSRAGGLANSGSVHERAISLISAMTLASPNEGTLR